MINDRCIVRRWLKKGMTFLLVTVCAGCTLMSSPAHALPVSPNASVYTYFVINGIARGSMMTGKLHPKDVKPLVAVDEQARRIIMYNLQHQTMRSDHQADIILEHYLSLIPR